MEGDSVCNLETKFHGINGQLPNLDFVNLLNKFIVADIVSSVPFAYNGSCNYLLISTVVMGY
jgi:hypothetical protein